MTHKEKIAVRRTRKDYNPKFFCLEFTMRFEALSIGKDIPNDFNVVIEIPARLPGIKYELDKDSGFVLVDRFMATPMYYPLDYGFIPHTLSEDGDPVDILLISPYPLQPGVVVRSRPLGLLEMEDEAGIDAKIIAVPVSKLTPVYDALQNITDVDPLLLEQIKHFFEHYKDLEKGKWVKVKGWKDADAARAEILACVARHAAQNH
jgi:inorganic pyrophosphatase